MLDDERIKLCIIGSSELDALTFTDKFALPLIKDDSTTKIGVHFYVKRFRFKTINRHLNIKFQLWAMSNDERFRILIPVYFRNTDGFIILLNLSTKDGYNEARYWLSIIKEERLKKPILLISPSLNEENVDSYLIDEIIHEPNVLFIRNPLKSESDIKNILNYLFCIIFNYQIPDSILAKLEIISNNYTDSTIKLPNEKFIRLEEEPTSITNIQSDYSKVLTDFGALIREPTIHKPLLNQIQDYIEQQEMKLNSMKGQFLEMNVRLLYQREYGYEMEYTGKAFMCEENEIDILYDNKCIKDRDSKDIEIDVFGKKIKDINKLTYLIGECKDRKKQITLKDIKCFIIKTSIIAEYFLYSHKREKKNIPKFNLLIVSYHGFPEKAQITQLLSKHWTLPKKRLVNEKIDLLEKNKLIELMKKNNISITGYKNSY